MPNKIVDFVLGLVKGLRTKSYIWFFPLTPKEGGIFMENKEEMATSLYAISIVARKLARQLLKEMEDKKDVKNKATDGNQRRCRESCI